MPSEGAVQQMWIASLAVYFVVVAVVAALLTLILQTAKGIRGGVAEIWVSGQKIANNTIQIPLLARTNRLLSRTLQAAVHTAEAVGALEQHSAACTQCPTCVIGPPPRG